LRNCWRVLLGILFFFLVGCSSVENADTCPPSIVFNPITGTAIAPQWAVWDSASSNIFYEEHTIGMTLDGRMIISKPRESVWFLATADYALTTVSLGQAIQNNDVRGMVYVASCKDNKNYVFADMSPIKVNLPLFQPLSD
jgi:hypothetical protein